MLRVSLIRLYLRIRSLAVLEVRDGDAFTCKRGKLDLEKAEEL